MTDFGHVCSRIGPCERTAQPLPFLSTTALNRHFISRIVRAMFVVVLLHEERSSADERRLPEEEGDQPPPAALVRAVVR